MRSLGTIWCWVIVHDDFHLVVVEVGSWVILNDSWQNWSLAKIDFYSWLNARFSAGICLFLGFAVDETISFYSAVLSYLGFCCGVFIVYHLLKNSQGAIVFADPKEKVFGGQGVNDRVISQASDGRGVITIVQDVFNSDELP